MYNFHQIILWKWFKDSEFLPDKNMEIKSYISGLGTEVQISFSFGWITDMKQILS